MIPAKGTGRRVGLLLLAHLAVGLMTPFIMLDMVRGAEGLVANAAARPGLFRAAVLLLYIGSGIAMAIAVAAWPVVRRHSQAIALWLMALAVAAFTLQVVDNAALMTLLSLSRETTAAASAGGAGAAGAAAQPALPEALGAILSASRRWVHYLYLLTAVGWIFLLYATLYRFRLVPRALAALGLIACPLQMAGVPLRALFGEPPLMMLAIPLGPVYLSLALWITWRGFPERQEVAGAASPEPDFELSAP
jgi:hypothetical protein